MVKIYLLQSVYESRLVYKIGFTKGSIESRIRQLSTGNCVDIKLVKYFDTDKYHSKIEKMLHKDYYNNRVNREWFYLDEVDVQNFIANCKKYYDVLDMLNQNNTYIQSKGGIK